MRGTGNGSNTWPRPLRWGLLGLALLAAGWATSAAAAGSDAPTLTVGRLWNQSGRAGTWSPYTITVRNDGGSTFTGTAALVPDNGFGKGLPTVFPPEYDAAVAVPGHSQRTVAVYAIETAGGYRAELRDPDGRVVATASPTTAGGNGPAVAIVSDLPQAAQRIDALLRARSSMDAAVSQLPGGQGLPADVTRLSGLNVLVLDQFDGGTLGASQRRTLQDFVGLGGTLIEAGGAGARRALGPLPADLVPMRPTGAATAALDPLAALGGVATAETAPVTTGDIAGWAKATVVAPDGTPLVVEGSYGAGAVVELAFDPLAAPFDGRLDLGATAWVQALCRGLTATMGSGSSQLTSGGFGVGVLSNGPPQGSGPGAATGFSGYANQVLAGSSSAPAPPFDLLAAFFVIYVLLVSGVTYVGLKAIGRSGLLWVAVPAAALVCTAGAYLVGFGTRGSDYQVTQVQVLRLAPGAVETTTYDGVLSPRRGDVSVTAPAGALVTTTTVSLGPYVYQTSGEEAARIAVGSVPSVTFPNVAVWDVRPLQTLAITDEGGGGRTMPIEAHLGLRAGRVTGQVVNHTGRAVSDLQLVSATGAQASLAATVAPGGTAAVDAPVSAGTSGPVIGKGVIGFPIAAFGPPSAENARLALLGLATTEVAVRRGEWALVGRVQPAQILRVAGDRPTSTGRAVVTEPVRLLTADSASNGAPPARLVSTYPSDGGGLVDLYELDVPAGAAGRLALTMIQLPGPGPSSAPELEVYDWDARAWIARAASAPLTSGQLRGGVVRARLTSGGTGQISIALSDGP